MIEACPICAGRDAIEVVCTLSPVFMMVPGGRDVKPDWFAELDVVQCRACGHSYNRKFDEALAERLYGDVPLTNVPVHPTMIGRLAALKDWLGDILDGKRV